MGRAPCCAKVGLHRGPWTPKEDALLTKYIHAHGEGQWKSLPKKAGLLRCGKSCRLRWMNYLRPDIKRGNITTEEDDLIIRMHALIGNRWSLIAGRLPGRTDNEIKNYWNTHLSKRVQAQQPIKDNTNNIDKAKNKIIERKKKKKKKAAKNNKSENKSDSVDEEGEKKANIYLPKPIRVRALHISSGIEESSNKNNGSSTSASGSSSQDLLLQKEDMDNYVMSYEPWESDVFGFFEEGDQNIIDQVNGSVSEENINNDIIISNSVNYMECESLERLYEEYLQLLKDDDNNVISGENQGQLWDC